MTIQNSTISGNTATGNGGGICANTNAGHDDHPEQHHFRKQRRASGNGGGIWAYNSGTTTHPEQHHFRKHRQRQRRRNLGGKLRRRHDDHPEQHHLRKHQPRSRAAESIRRTTARPPSKTARSPAILPTAVAAAFTRTTTPTLPPRRRRPPSRAPLLPGTPTIRLLHARSFRPR